MTEPVLITPRRTYRRALTIAPEGKRCWMCGDVRPQAATHVHVHGSGAMYLCRWHAQRVAAEIGIPLPAHRGARIDDRVSMPIGGRSEG